MGLFENNLITKEEVKVLIGLDLDTIRDDANPSNKAERFIYEAQTILSSFVRRNYKNDLEKWYHAYCNNNERQHIKMAIAKQVEYQVLNGKIGNDVANFDNRASFDKNLALVISPYAIMELGEIRRLTTTAFNDRGILSDYLATELFGR